MRAPDISGTTGKAWKSTMPSTELAKKWPAGLDMWLMHRPGSHPFWSWYVVTGCSLRDVTGLPPAKKRSPDMTHEIMVLALDPAYTPDDSWCTDTEGRWAKYFLTPPDLSEQLGGFTDEKLNELVFSFVRAFCTGYACPDQDYRSYNRRLLETTADHLRRDLHEVL
jgi:hypothetical protein